MRAKQSKKNLWDKSKTTQNLQRPSPAETCPRKIPSPSPSKGPRTHGKSVVLDILSCIRAHIPSSLLHRSAGYQFPGAILEPNNLAISASNSLLPESMRPGNGISALCSAPNITMYIRVRIRLGGEHDKVELALIQIVPNVPSKRSIGTNKVATARRSNSCHVEEASNSERRAIGEMKPGINLINVDQFNWGSGIGSDIYALNVTKNTNELVQVLAGLYVLTGSFAKLLPSIELEDRQPTLVWNCIAIYNQ